MKCDEVFREPLERKILKSLGSSVFPDWHLLYSIKLVLSSNQIELRVGSVLCWPSIGSTQSLSPKVLFTRGW